MVHMVLVLLFIRYLEYGHHKGYFTLPAGTVTSKLEDFE